MNGSGTVHERLAAHVRDEQQAWRDVVAQVGDERMRDPGPMGEWSFEDLAAHLLGWRERTIGRLEALAAGGPEPRAPWPAELDDDDEINDWIQAEHADRPTRDVLDAIDRSYDRIGAALAALTEEQLADPAAMPWLDGSAAADINWFSHWHEEHEPTVRAWLAERG